jgi:hypothetical protein
MRAAAAAAISIVEKRNFFMACRRLKFTKTRVVVCAFQILNRRTKKFAGEGLYHRAIGNLVVSLGGDCFFAHNLIF